MRLIDADFEIQYWKDILCNPTPDVTQYDKERAPHAIEALKLAATVDAVEVVRCKDCRFHEDEQPGMVYCPAVVGGWVEDDWFCKGGERKTDG